MLKSLIAVVLIYGLDNTLAASVDVSLYYESLCPDSMNFINNQLFPTYKIIGDDIKLELVPYGFAQTYSNGTFTCQHGPEECYGNKIQSCAIALYSVEESAEFVYCSMSSDDPSSEENLEKCATSTGISWTSLNTCFTSGQADELLKMNGEKTAKLDPPLSNLPTVIFNGKYDESIEEQALTDFTAVVCDYLDNEPSVC